MSYTCGATLEDITMPESLESVCIEVYNCYDPTEKLGIITVYILHNYSAVFAVHNKLNNNVDKK